VRLSNCDIVYQSIEPNIQSLMRSIWNRNPPVHTFLWAWHWHIMEKFSIWYKVYQLMPKFRWIHRLFYIRTKINYTGVWAVTLSEIISTSVRNHNIAINRANQTANSTRWIKLISKFRKKKQLSLQLQSDVTYMILFKIFLSSSKSVVSGNLHNPWLCKKRICKVPCISWRHTVDVSSTHS